MQEKKNVPQRPHIVRNITGRCSEFPLESVLEMCISGHADCRFFFVIIVFLCPKIRACFMSFPSLAEALKTENYCWVSEFHNRNWSNPRALVNFRRKTVTTSYWNKLKYQELHLLSETVRCHQAPRRKDGPTWNCLHPLCSPPSLGHLGITNDGRRGCIRIFFSFYQIGLFGIKITVPFVYSNSYSLLFIISYKAVWNLCMPFYCFTVDFFS